MTVLLTGIEWDALDPERLVRFWSSLLGRDSSGLIIPDAGSGYCVTFVATTEPKKSQNRIHLDLTSTSAGDQASLVHRAIQLGGMHVDVGQLPDEPHFVLADPEGNEFCVIEPGNRFLGNTDLVGAVNCDGTRDLGLFWSAALDWPLVWDQDEETAIQSPQGGSKITWSGPPLKPRYGRDRLRFEVSSDSSRLDVELRRLVSLGAIASEPNEGGARTLVDPDGNEFVLTPRA